MVIRAKIRCCVRSRHYPCSMRIDREQINIRACQLVINVVVCWSSANGLICQCLIFRKGHLYKWCVRLVFTEIDIAYFNDIGIARHRYGCGICRNSEVKVCVCPEEYTFVLPIKLHDIKCFRRIGRLIGCRSTALNDDP